MANTIWSVARQLATPSYSSTAMNSQKMARMIKELLITAACKLSSDVAAVDASEKVGALTMQAAVLKAEMKRMKKELGAKGTAKTEKEMDAALADSSQED